MRANNTLVYVCFFLCYCCSIRFQRALFGKGKKQPRIWEGVGRGESCRETEGGSVECVQLARRLIRSKTFRKLSKAK